MSRAIIIGAGIGGLSAALALGEEGWEVAVFEAVGTLKPLGVGINLLPHGARVLHGLGLGNHLDATGIRTRAIEYRTKFGHVITSDPRGVEAGFDHPQYSIHRGDLQRLLLDAVVARFGADAVRTGCRLRDFDQRPDGVVARFATRDGGVMTAEGDILVGADGFHSVVRAQLLPNAGAAQSEGVTMWRGACAFPPVGDGRTMFIAGDHDVKAVVYPISESLRRSGRSLVNWVAEVRHGRPGAASDADWTKTGSRDFIERFRDFEMADIDLVGLFEATDDILEYPMIDREPLPQWSFGRVTLLGDAAHSMYPIGANGSSQAILDAEALAAALRSEPVVDALRAYDAERRPVTTRVVLANRKAGPEEVLDIAAARIKSRDDRLEDLISPEEVEAVARRYRRIAGFRKSQEASLPANAP